MAHQPDKIPWQLLVSHLDADFDLRDTRASEATANLVMCELDTLHQDASTFISAFVTTLKEASRVERAKYPAAYAPPADHDLLIGDEIALTMTSMVKSWRIRSFSVRGHWDERDYFLRQENIEEKMSNDVNLCNHRDGFRCRCILPYQEREAAAFLREREYSSCYELLEKNARSFFNLEVVKTLLLFGDMDPILRACAHPENYLSEWQNAGECQCIGDTAGWDMLYKNALDMYLFLNIFYCFPELWPSENGKESKKDYRRTAAYQQAVWDCTSDSITSCIAEMPHQEFLNTGYKCTHGKPKTACGTLAFDDFMTENYHERPLVAGPLDPDVEAAVWTSLRDKELPNELICAISEHARPIMRVLRVPDDPMHPLNREELQKYLDQCWNILVRCSIMIDELGVTARWRINLLACIMRKVSCPRDALRELWSEVQAEEPYE